MFDTSLAVSNLMVSPVLRHTSDVQLKTSFAWTIFVGGKVGNWLRFALSYFKYITRTVSFVLVGWVKKFPLFLLIAPA
jgi:hypothetical protein